MRWLVITLVIITITSTCQGILYDLYKQLILGAITDTSGDKLLKHYDFIIIGSGPGGATVANRLTEIPQWNVLLLEAGDEENQIGQIPAMTSYLQQTKYDWIYRSEVENNTCLGYTYGKCKLHVGTGMGGSSILSYMIYSRGNPRDYDLWKVLGNKGWDWEGVLPYFLKSEGARGKLLNSDYHSKGGYLDVDKPYITGLTKAFIDSAKDLDYTKVDYNSGEQVGFSLLQINVRNGSRCTSNSAFIKPIRNRINFHVSKNSLVNRIIIDPKTRKAIGVEFRKNGRVYRIYAKKEVIISAGAINTPKLLMLSGIGPRDHLKSLGIPVIRNLAGVGQNLQDHVTMSGLAFVVNRSMTMIHDRIITPRSIYKYYINGKGPLTSVNGLSAVGFIRTPLSDKPLDYPDIELLFLSSNIASDNGINFKKGLGIRDDIYNPVYNPLHGKDAWSIWPILLQPKSKGYIKLKNRNIYTKPKIYTNYLKDEHDMLTLIEGIKISVKMSNFSSFIKYDSKLHDIPIPPCTGYIFKSDDYWRCVSQQLTTPMYNFCCTAKMGQENDTLAVVDNQLRVYGIKNLRIIDASVMPKIPAAHTMAPTYMIAEKAADYIKKSYGFPN